MTSPSTVLVHADVRTLVPSRPRAEAIAWRDGALVSVGARDEVMRDAAPVGRTWDAGGATVLPGFTDAHQHPCILALYGGSSRLVPPAVTDIASLQRALAAACASLSDGEWVVAYDWDEFQLAERRAPTLDELDAAVGQRPLFALHYSGHRALANRSALALAAIDRHTADPSGGAIARGKDGSPSGVLIERGMSRVESLARRSLVARDPESYLSRLAAHHRALLAAGITRVVDATVPTDLATLYREAARRGLLTVPTVMLPVSVNGYLETPWDALDGPVTGEREGVLEVGPVKLVFDGAPGCAMCLSWWQTAAMTVRSLALAVRYGSLDPVRTLLATTPTLGWQIRTGIRIYARDEATAIVKGAVDRGFAVATHAIGNEAIDTALGAYESAGAALSRRARPRLEHAMFLDRETVRRIAGVGAAVVTQPNFLAVPAIASAASIPRVRNMPLRWLLDAGVAVAGSSDFPVAGFDPLDAIRAAVTRRTAIGRTYEPDQCITVDEALTLYTRTAAEVSGAGDRCGTLEAGKRADLLVLSGPISTPASLEGVRVASTVLAGDVVFGEPGTPSAR